MYSKTGSVAKLFFILSVVGLLMYVVLGFYSFHLANKNFSLISSMQRHGKKINRLDLSKEDTLKYILVWKTKEEDVFSNYGEGQAPFVVNRCPTVSCYLTTDKHLLDGDYSNFHAILFNMSIVYIWTKINIPDKRSPHQKYVFHSMLPATSYPICNVKTDNFFNWTWTYKLNSDIVSPFIEVMDKSFNKVAPDNDIEWIEDVDSSVEDDVTLMKSNALVWVMEDCNNKNNIYILRYARRLQKLLRENRLIFDIFGCGMKECKPFCNNVLRNYYFYFAHETSFSEDYVTAEVMKGYNAKSVPIVFGGADYTKFLPHKSYINARDMSPTKLAALINYNIRNQDIYKGYFRWKTYYEVQKATLTPGLCQLCADLNDENKYTNYTNYEFFRKWWYNATFHKKCIPKGSDSIKAVLSYINTTKPQGNTSYF